MSSNRKTSQDRSNSLIASVTQNLPLTTVFIPPTECITPFITIPDAGCDDITCFALFMPSLEIDSSTGGAHLQCLPSFATDSDFNESPIFTYSPGLLCPSGMTTASSQSDTAVCCPSGLTCTDIGTNDKSYKCTATLTTGIFGQGGWGENPDIGYISSTTVLSRNFHQIIFAQATPVILVRQNTDNNDTSSISSDPASSRDLINSSAVTTGSTTAQPRPTNTSIHQSGSNTAAIVGGVVGAVAIILLIALAYFFLARYRRRKHQIHTMPSNDANLAQEYPSDGAGGFWGLKPELDPTATRSELEGTTVDHQGPGIYVVKPELEGTIGRNRLLGVFVKGKAELEGNGTK
ncbi:hypothetical protein F5B22DRAFT_626230 [Xylaria bambusicola]|uniref:uncharacterized protein n=1 Tax=Xylaria bambusicola TaxID=326684 RepID=UPI00200724C3|nr:uncharacterized protein F5B22DRAFT_626230 [Xylaria bambusicola]KAI0505883.1 hypothetical protein F5B22DRAFT_626230 [Xylaria bambusicola]